jgi:hypothetical protein
MNLKKMLKLYDFFIKFKFRIEDTPVQNKTANGLNGN